jgi:cell shape-determining protein MreD
LALLLAVALVALTTRRFHRDNLFLPIVAVALAAACYEVTLAALYQLATNWAAWRTYLLDVVLPITLFASIPALPCFLVLRLLTRRRDALDISGGRL